MALNSALASATVPATARDTRALARVWATLQPDSCPETYNFHMHTVCSDGQLHPHSLIEQAVNIGLQGLAITDHHTVRGYQAAQEWLDARRPHRPHPQLWTGVEVTASLLDTEVHILGYGFDPSSAALAPYLQGSAPRGDAATAQQTIAALHAAGALVVLAHPERYRRPARQLIPAAAALGIDGVETYYAYRHVDPWQPTPAQTMQVQELAAQYGLLNTCGTDTHGTNLLIRL